MPCRITARGWNRSRAVSSWRNVVSKEFTHSPVRAREQLTSVICKALNKMEDRPIVDRLGLHLDFS